MINNKAIESVVLPYPDRIDVWRRENWTYDLLATSATNQVPQNIPRDDTTDDDIDDEYDWRNMSHIHNTHPPHFSPAQTTHGPSNHFASTSSGFYYDENTLWEQRACEEEYNGLCLYHVWVITRYDEVHAGITTPNRPLPTIGDWTLSYHGSPTNASASFTGT